LPRLLTATAALTAAIVPGCCSSGMDGIVYGHENSGQGAGADLREDVTG
jgi:hypothetical protein